MPSVVVNMTTVERSAITLSEPNFPTDGTDDQPNYTCSTTAGVERLSQPSKNSSITFFVIDEALTVANHAI